MNTFITCPACLETNVPVIIDMSEIESKKESICPFCKRKIVVRIEILVSVESVEYYNPHAKGFWGDE